jgi:hypothetical protein
MQTAPGSFLLTCNGSTVTAEIRSLADGGFLVIKGGKSHVAYMKDEAGGEREEGREGAGWEVKK